jgi:hypothetical protein
MDISVPSGFPLIDFRAFGRAQKYFPKLLSDEDLNDPQESILCRVKKAHYPVAKKNSPGPEAQAS